MPSGNSVLMHATVSGVSGQRVGGSDLLASERPESRLHLVAQGRGVVCVTHRRAAVPAQEADGDGRRAVGGAPIEELPELVQRGLMIEELPDGRDGHDGHGRSVGNGRFPPIELAAELPRDIPEPIAHRGNVVAPGNHLACRQA